jgi:hypothetical protein
MINIPEKICIGHDADLSYGNKLSITTVLPVGDSVNEKKKLEKLAVDNKLVTTFDNVPMPGFSLFDMSRSVSSHAAPTWRVVDPRGYACRIDLLNLENILRCSAISNNLIQEECVWIRNDSSTEMELVPITDSRYAKILDNTKLIDNKVQLSDVSIGDTVLLQHGITGEYCGVMSLYGTLTSSIFGGTLKVHSSVKKQVIKRTDIPSSYFYNKDAKILSIIKKAESVITQEESIKRINEHLKVSGCIFSDTSYSPFTNYTKNMRFVSKHPVPKPSITLVEISKDEAYGLLGRAATGAMVDPGVLILENNLGIKYVLDNSWWGALASPPAVGEFAVRELKLITDNSIELMPHPNKGLPINLRVHNAYKTIDSFTKFYKIVKHVRKETYI